MTQEILMNEPRPAIPGEWPSNGLENVHSCPICQKDERSILYEEMEDELFFCAPGKWTLYGCTSCGAAYLDPRPTPETIGLAYSSYYTHGSQRPTILPQATNTKKMVSAILKNSYLNFRYGISLAKTPKLPKWMFKIVYFTLPIRSTLDRWVRHLKPPAAHSRLLEVGCGNGYFLQIAKLIGWHVTGIDVDSAAVENARKLGVDAFESSVYHMPFENDTFDIVTMNHVIEHLHDPGAALAEILRILKPRGKLWIGTPNLNSKVHSSAGVRWIGLDPPRHLVMFDHHSLMLAFKRAGFPDPVRRRVAWTDRGDWELIVTAQKPANS
jgi:SAM-dependent methyltransferase